MGESPFALCVHLPYCGSNAGALDADLNKGWTWFSSACLRLQPMGGRGRRIMSLRFGPQLCVEFQTCLGQHCGLRPHLRQKRVGNTAWFH